MNTKNKSLPIGTSLLITEHPTLQAKGRLFFCSGCKELKEYEAKGLCRRCYMKKRHLENKKKLNEASRKWQKENPEKVKINMERYYIKNKDKINARAKKWQLNNPKKVKARDKKYRLRNLEKLNKRIRKWRLENPEKMKASSKRYKLENKEKVKAKEKKYWRENPGKMREKSLKRRGYGIPEKGTIDKIITENILKYGSTVCEKCKEKCPDNYHVDHIIPLSKGGPNDYDNLQILCEHCNCSKQTEVADYRQNRKNKQMFLKTQKEKS